MDKGTRIITIIIALIIAITAILLAFFITRSRMQSDAKQTEVVGTDEKVTLFSGNIEQMKEMHITNRNGTYTVVPYNSKQGQNGFIYTLAEMDIGMVDVAALYNIVKYGCNPISTKDLGKVDNLSEYGLDAPMATVSVIFENGETYDYQIGNAVNERSDRYYMCAKDSRNVYVIMVYPAMLGEVEGLMNTASDK